MQYRVYVDKMALMFSYGMNTNRTLMQLRCKEAVAFSVGYIEGFKLVFRYHADLMPTGKTKDRVYGVIWQLSEEDLSLVDVAESYPEYYNRDLRFIKINNSQLSTTAVNAWTYTMNGDSPQELPEEQYYDLIKQGYQENGVPTGQLEEALERCNLHYDINHQS